MIKMTANDLASVICSLITFESDCQLHQERINYSNITDELNRLKRSVDSLNRSKADGSDIFDIEEDDVQF